MAAALLHEPEILFLDEPTSGADPLARRAFWRRITALAEQGVTVIVTTHFMQEAEYCDRVAIMDSGRILAQGSPAQVRELARTDAMPEPSMEDAFIAVVEGSRERLNSAAGARSPRDVLMSRSRKLQRIRALVWKETRRSCAIPPASPSAWCCR